jgi:hypothetical protein
VRPAVFRSAHYLLALAGIRLSLAALGFVASVAAGAGARSAGVGVAFGAAASAVALLTDRRSLLVRRLPVEPLPEAARHAPLWRAVARGLLPSTAGVAALLVASLAFEPVLAAVLAGILAGMGGVGFAAFVELSLLERQRRARFFTDGAGPVRRYVAPR